MSLKSFVYAITVVAFLGVLPSAYSAGAATSAGWGTAQLIETDAGDAAGPQLSVDDSGAATVVWEQNNNFWSNRYSVSGQALGEVEIGVKSGDWIKIDYEFSGAPSGIPLPTWIKMEFLNVEGTNATVRVTMHMSDGTEENATVAVDIVGGGEALGLSGFVIPANLTVGDTIHMSGYGDIMLAGETDGSYAGASRRTLYASISEYGIEITYYWDKQTGVMVEARSISGSVTETAKAVETNMWEAQPGILSNSTVLYALAIGAIVIVVAVALLVKRRKKEPNLAVVKAEEPPTAPPGT